MGVLTHLDGFKDNKRLKKTKKVLKHRFWAEIYQGLPQHSLFGMCQVVWWDLYLFEADKGMRRCFEGRYSQKIMMKKNYEE